VTATVNAPKVSVGMTVFVLGCADTSFNGTFTVVSNTGSAITWAQTAANDTDTTATLLYTPTDIVTACRRLAAWMYQTRDSSGEVQIVENVTNVPAEAPPMVRRILSKYAHNLLFA